MNVNIYDILYVYEKEISKSVKNKKKLYKFEINKMNNINNIYNILNNFDNYFMDIAENTRDFGHEMNRTTSENCFKINF